MNNIQHLLSHISTIIKKNEEILEATGGRFNMFRILGVNHYENTHSAILAEFLNPKGSHGLKHHFLESFIKNVNSEDNYLVFDYTNTTVRTEAVTKYGRIDILIEDKKGHSIIIENKVYADDQWEQLKRYNDFAINKYGTKNYKIFYLTLNGTDASKHSGSGVDYKPISYKINIIQWLEECVKISSRFPLVRETINQYINSLKQLTNQDMDTVNKNEIVDLVTKSPENLKSAMTIISNELKIKQAVIKKLFDDLEKIAEKYDLVFVGDDDFGNVYSGFSFHVKLWNNCKIGFEFQSKNLRDMGFGIYYKSEKHLKSLTLETCMELEKILRSKSTDYWPAYRDLDYYRNWDNSTYIDIIEGKYSSFIDEKIMEVLTVTEGMNL